MENFEEYMQMLNGKDKRLLTNKEKDLIKLMNAVYRTIEGMITIPGLINMYGEPVIIKKYAKIEVKTGNIKMPFIAVERFVDAVLKFSDNIVIQGIPQKILLDIPHSGIEIHWVRMDDYKSSSMPKATKAEIRKAQAEREKKGLPV